MMVLALDGCDRPSQIDGAIFFFAYILIPTHYIASQNSGACKIIKIIIP